MGALILRGVLAGAIAGLLAGVFLLAIGEPLIEQALTYEVHAPDAEVFSRDVQRVGLLAATTLYGVGIGGLYGFAFGLIGPRLRTGSIWERAVRLALAAFVGIWLVPFLKYPANPPGVGDPETAADRTTFYLMLVAISIIATVGAYLVARVLEDRRVPPHVRLPLVVTGYGLAIAVAFAVLPDANLQTTIPASLLWNTRLASLGGQALLWSILGVTFGTLAQRLADRSPRSVLAPAGR
jgi:predicted cobalt transporter CbtA